MKIKKEKWDTLDGVLDKIWLMLEQGADHSDDPFHWPDLDPGLLVCHASVSKILILKYN